MCAPGVPGVHVGAVPDRAGHHAQAVLPGQDVPGVRHGGRVHGAHVARLPAGVLAERHGPAGHAAVVADAAPVDRLPGAGGLPRAARRSHVPAGLPVEARGGTGADRDAGDPVQQPATVAQHTSRPRGPPFPVLVAQTHHGREYNTHSYSGRKRPVRESIPIGNDATPSVLYCHQWRN